MISSLRGTVIAAGGATNGAHNAILDVGGVGYSIAITPQHSLALRIGSEALIQTALIVREDEMSLYGFAERDELEVFDLLRGVTGVGPKSALGVLAAMDPTLIAAAVEHDDDSAFRKVSGIGPKTAKLIVVSLAGKLASYVAGPTQPGGRPGVRSEALVALTSLGFQERRVEEALDEVLGEAPDSSVATIVRRALAALGPAGVR